nr:VCBS repeat-containing protein [Rhizobiaceae bacterium]
MRALVIFIAMFVHFAVSKPARSSDYPGAIPDLRVARGTGLIAEAWLADPTTRYRHFVLGSDYEAASLVVRTRDGDLAKLTLPRNAVFEDRQPRLADIDGDGVDEIIVVRSDPRRGAALVVVALVDGKLAVRWESEPTGRANTWLNPAGIADFDGDGRLDIAYVQMPHVLGLLRVWTLRKGQFEEMAQLPGFSNHEIGSPHLGLSAVADFD